MRNCLISWASDLVYHSGRIQGGFLGVDVFFTLSGVLMTTLLIEECARGGTVAIGLVSR